MPPSPGLKFAFALNHTRIVGVRLNEYRAPVETVGLVASHALHTLIHYADFLGQGFDKDMSGKLTHPPCGYPRSKRSSLRYGAEICQGCLSLSHELPYGR